LYLQTFLNAHFESLTIQDSGCNNNLLVFSHALDITASFRRRT